MNNKLVCKVLVLGTLACGLQSMAFANEVSDTNVGNGGANSQKTHTPTWLDRTDIGISWEAGKPSANESSTNNYSWQYNDAHTERRDVSSQNTKKGVNKAYIETLQPIGHYDENSKSVVFLQGKLGRGGQFIRSQSVRGYLLPEFRLGPYGFNYYVQQNTDSTSSESLGGVGSLGLGYRHMSRGDNAYVGVNAFVDRSFKDSYQRVSGGLEYVVGHNEFYANIYKGLGTSGFVKTMGGTTDLSRLYTPELYPNGLPDGYPTWNTIPYENYNSYDMNRALSGYDVGYARTFKNARWVRLYANAYAWKGTSGSHGQEYYYIGQGGPLFGTHGSSSYRGLRFGSEMQLTPSLSLDLGYNKKKYMASGIYVELKYTLGKSKFAYFGGQHSDDGHSYARSKMLGKVHRLDMTVESSHDVEYFYGAPIDHL